MSRLTAVLLIPFLLMSSCIKGFSLDAFMPKVNFQRLAVRDLDFRHIETDFVFNVNNPNPIRVGLSSFSYNLDLGGQQFIKGNQGDGLKLEARGDSKMVFPVEVVFADLIQLVSGVQGKDAVPFSFRGKIGFNTPLGEIKIPFSESGDFPVIQAPKIAIKGVRVGQLNLLRQSATISIDLGLTQKGGSALDLSAFDYGLTLSGRQVAEGVIGDFAKVPVGEEKVVSIPIQINLLEVGATIVDAITRKTKLKVGLDAKLSVGTPFGVVPLSIDETGLVKVE